MSGTVRISQTLPILRPQDNAGWFIRNSPLAKHESPQSSDRGLSCLAVSFKICILSVLYLQITVSGFKKSVSESCSENPWSGQTKKSGMVAKWPHQMDELLQSFRHIQVFNTYCTCAHAHPRQSSITNLPQQPKTSRSHFSYFHLNALKE